MTRLYTNENFPFPVVEELRRLGHDVLTSQERGMAGQAIDDEKVLATACLDDRTLVTLNRRHFIRLHEKMSGHRGIVVCSVDSDSVALAERIHGELQTKPSMVGQLVRINRPPR